MTEAALPRVSPGPEARSRSVFGVVPIIPSTYCFYGLGITKLDVLGRSYDLWRRLT